jgi:hypothetical protein
VFVDVIRIKKILKKNDDAHTKITITNALLP